MQAHFEHGPRDGFRRRAIIAGLGGTFVASALAACSGRDSQTPLRSSDPAKLPGPERLRATARTLAPTDYAATYEVGHDKRFSTVKDAIEAVTRDQNAELGITGGGPPVSQAGPWRRRRIRVYPGSYPEGLLTLPPHSALVGATGKPSDVILSAGGEENVLGTGGRSVYVSGLTLRATSSSPIAHPLNDSGPAGDAGLGPRQVRTVIIDNCILDCARSGLAGKAAVDLTPGAGTTLVFNKCSFLCPGQPQAINCVIGTGEGRNTSDVFFIDSHVQANYERHEDPGISGSGEGPAYPVGIVQANTKRKDRVVWLGGSWDISTGTEKSPIGALLALGYDHVHEKKSAATWYVMTPGARAGVQTIHSDAGTDIQHSLPSSIVLPDQGMSAQEIAYYGEQPGSTQTAFGGAAKASTMKIQAGQIFWVAVDLGGKAAFSRAVRLTGVRVPFVAGAALDDGGRPMKDANGQAIGSATKGTMDRADLPGRWFYPGQGKVWVGIAFGADATVPARLVSRGHAFTARGYATGAGMPVPDDKLTLVPGGGHVPDVALISALPATYPTSAT